MVTLSVTSVNTPLTATLWVEAGEGDINSHWAATSRSTVQSHGSPARSRCSTGTETGRSVRGRRRYGWMSLKYPHFLWRTNVSINQSVRQSISDGKWCMELLESWLHVCSGPLCSRPCNETTEEESERSNCNHVRKVTSPPHRSTHHRKWPKVTRLMNDIFNLFIIFLVLRLRHLRQQNDPLLFTNRN